MAFHPIWGEVDAKERSDNSPQAAAVNVARPYIYSGCIELLQSRLADRMVPCRIGNGREIHQIS